MPLVTIPVVEHIRRGAESETREVGRLEIDENVADIIAAVVSAAQAVVRLDTVVAHKDGRYRLVEAAFRIETA